MTDLIKGLRGELAIDCMCAARSSDECGCEAMWPDQFTDRAANEIERLEAALRWEQHRADRIGTHWPDCHLAGQMHYECLLREYERLTAELATSKKQIGSYKTLTHALEKQVSNYRNVSGRYQEAIKTMQSERDANAILTDELTESRDLAEHWAILAEQRRVELGRWQRRAEYHLGLACEHIAENSELRAKLGMPVKELPTPDFFDDAMEAKP